MSPDRIQIDPDIRRAQTLPSSVYCDPAWFARQRESVFRRSWQWIGDAAGLEQPGHVRPLTLLPGCMDEPLLLSTDQEGGLHCLSNVCTHRGNLVVDAEGDLTSLRCRYHGRRFSLDGNFVSMPAFDGVDGFPTPADNLPRLEHERWGPFLFASLDPGMPFEKWIEPLRARFEWLSLERFTFDPATSRDYLIEANWALYCDNYLEGFHIPYVHRGLADKLEWPAYKTELFRFGSIQIGVAAPEEPGFPLPPSHPDQGKRIAAYYAWLFPNIMFNFYPWGLSVNLIEPLGPERTRVRFLSYVENPELRGQGAGAELHRVELEDEEVVQSVQRGVRSRLYERGRYSPAQETGIHHFHRLLAEFLNQGSEE